jgi:hypothetical protein
MTTGRTRKARGMKLADEQTPEQWKLEADAAILAAAATGRPFTASDLPTLTGLGDPDKSCRWGPRMLCAARAGIITPVGVVTSRRKTVHASLVREWVGTGEVR